MFFYIIITIITLIFYFLTRYEYSQSPKSFVGIVLLVLFPSIWEGIRSEEIGTDIQTYGLQYFEYSLNAKGIFNLFRKSPTNEYGYIFLNYICSRFSKDIHFFFFVVGLIKASCVAWVSLNFRKQYIGALFLFAYMMCFYWQTFSLLRQGVAMAISCMAILFYLKAEYKKAAIGLLISYTFHNSAVFLLILPIVHIAKKYIKYPLAWAAVGMFLIYKFMDQLFLLVATSGLFKEEMLDLYEDSGVTLAKINLLISVFFFLYAFLFEYRQHIRLAHIRKRFKRMYNIGCADYRKIDLLRSIKRDTDLKSYLIKVNALVCLGFLLLSSQFEVGFRISYYQVLFLIILVPMTLPRLTRVYRVIIVGCYAILFVLFFYLNAQHGLADTLPYESDVLGVVFE